MRTLQGFSKLLAAAGMLALAWSTPALGDGYVTFGTQGWEQSAPEAHYQAFNEAARGVFVESFLYRNTFGKGRAAIWGRNLIRSDEAIGFRYLQPRWRVDVDYIQTPHNLSFITRTGYAATTDPATQLLPDSLQRANQDNSGGYVSTMNDFLAQANKFNLGFRTDVLSARMRGRPGNGVKVELKGTRRNRAGDKGYGGSFGFNNTIETIEPIRQTMADAEGRVSYSHDRLSLEGVANFSAFENDHSTLIWDNPRTLTDVVGTPGKGKMDLYPDNQSWRVTGQVGLQLPRRTAFTGSYAFGQATQNDPWLPFTVNSAVLAPDTFPLPGTQTYAKANLTTIDARLTSHPIAKLGGTLRFSENKYDNKTPQWTLSGQVPYDGAWNGTDVTTHPYGNEQTVYGADLDWNPISLVGLYGTLEHLKRDHTYREVPEDEEDALGGKVVVRPRSELEASVRFRHGDRKVNEFELDDYKDASGTLTEQPTLRRYDVASRVQDLVDAGLAWSHGDRATVTLTYNYLRNDYDESGMGLTDDLRRSASIDADLSATDRIDLTGSFGWAWLYGDQKSRTSNSGTVVLADTLNWEARLYDEIITATGGVTWRAIPDRVALSVGYHYERAPGTYELTSYKLTPPAQNLPGTVYMREGVDVEVRYSLMENTDVMGRWSWEEFNANDFATEDIPLLFQPTATTSTAIFLGDSVLDYRANMVALAFQRRF